jgi:sialidase-1
MPSVAPRPARCAGLLLAVTIVVTFAAALLLEGLAMAQPAAPTSQVLVANTAEHPRNGEGDIIRLKNGDLLLGYGRWNAGGGDSGGDFGKAEIWAKVSHDGGKSWGEDRCLVPNEGQVTTFEAGFCRLRNGEILLSYCTKDSTEDCSVCFRRSPDEGKTWRRKVKYAIPRPYTGYTGINNNRLIQLSTGRLLLPAYDGWVRGTVIVSFALYSDDNGRTWQKSNDVDIRSLAPDDPYGADEPAVVELKDGRVLMLVRTGRGFIAKAYSTDHGTTLGKPEPIQGLVAPNSPCSIARLPQTGDLLLVWNNNRSARNPLNSAISRDQGETWGNIRVVDGGAASFCYTSITPVDDRVLLTYYGRGGLVLKSVPWRWFYAPAGPQTVWTYDGEVQEARPGWRLTKGAAIYIQDTAEKWDGSKVTEVRATVVLRSLLAGKAATAMLWIGDPTPNLSCALYLRAGSKSDAVSFSQAMAPAVELGDSGRKHTYRVVLNRQSKQAELFVDGADQAALTAPLGPVLSVYNMNRILYGDPNVEFLGGESDLLELKWQ